MFALQAGLAHAEESEAEQSFLDRGIAVLIVEGNADSP